MLEISKRYVLIDLRKWSDDSKPVLNRGRCVTIELLVVSRSGFIIGDVLERGRRNLFTTWKQYLFGDRLT